MFPGPRDGAEGGIKEEFVRKDKEGAGFAFKAGGVADVGGITGDDGIEFQRLHLFANAADSHLHFLRCKNVWQGHR